MTIKAALTGSGATVARMLASGLFMPRCHICAADLVWRGETIICSDCRQNIRLSTENQCLRCGKFIPAGVETCASCLLQPPPFLRHIAYAAYEGTLREVIIRYKYGEVEALKILLTSLYMEMVQQQLLGGFQAVVPVPADRGRRHGFMPVWTMGRLLARLLGVSFRPDLLQKKKSTPPQVGLSQARRQTNLAGAFAQAAGAKGGGLHVLLIDDVTTTGATLRHCSVALKKGGARVTALTLAQSRL
ncbi:MAG TPA: double zinc ribbon domain-containing protein [Candidatus Binatia bacterium]|nr:double zinc ribbon domain-containing protein [Candidatus Binatia bacterium]